MDGILDDSDLREQGVQASCGSWAPILLSPCTVDELLRTQGGYRPIDFTSDTVHVIRIVGPTTSIPLFEHAGEEEVGAQSYGQFFKVADPQVGLVQAEANAPDNSIRKHGQECNEDADQPCREVVGQQAHTVRLRLTPNGSALSCAPAAVRG